MIEPLPAPRDDLLAFKLSGKLHDEDYQTFVPAIDAALERHPKVRLFAQFHDFHGWDARALWDDVKFSTTHCTKIDRIALIGEKRWQQGMAAVCKPFTMATVKYFDAAEAAQAMTWLESDV